jgi:hypothetical protein
VQHDIDQLGHEDVESKPDRVDRYDLIWRQIEDGGRGWIFAIDVNETEQEPQEARDGIAKDESTGEVDDIKVDQDVGDGGQKTEPVLVEEQLPHQEIQHPQEGGQSKTVLDRGLKGSTQGDDRLDTETDPLESGGEGGYLTVDREHDDVKGDEIEQLVVHREERLEVILASGGEA